MHNFYTIICSWTMNYLLSVKRKYVFTILYYMYGDVPLYYMHGDVPFYYYYMHGDVPYFTVLPSWYFASYKFPWEERMIYNWKDIKTRFWLLSKLLVSSSWSFTNYVTITDGILLDTTGVSFFGRFKKVNYFKWILPFAQTAFLVRIIFSVNHSMLNI